MARTRQYYMNLYTAVWFSATIILFLIISIIHRRVNWFLLIYTLGIEYKKDDPPKKAVFCSKCKKGIYATKQKNIDKGVSQHLKYDNGHARTMDAPKQLNQADIDSTQQVEPTDTSKNKPEFEKYLYIELDEEDVPQMKCYVRILSDLLAATIFTLFIFIIFQDLFLSVEYVFNNEPCPDYEAECFTETGPQIDQLYNCTSGTNISITGYNGRLACFGWVFEDKTAGDILETLGTCGGLLGLTSGIIPVVYYLSYYKKNWCLSCLCIIIPIGGFVGVVLTLWYNWETGSSQLAWAISYLFVALLLIGWSWGIWKSCKNEKFCGLCYPRRSSCDDLGSKICLCIEHCCSKLCGHCFHILCKEYKYYPWECLRDICKLCLCYENNSENSQYLKDSNIKGINKGRQTATPVIVVQPNSLGKKGTK